MIALLRFRCRRFISVVDRNASTVSVYNCCRMIFLFRFRAGTNNIIKFDLRNDQLVAQRSHGYYNRVRRYYYHWGGYSGMDLAVDESGLWVLSGYSGYGGRLAAAMIDPTSLITRHVFNAGGETQTSMGKIL